MKQCDNRPAYLRVFFDGAWHKVIFSDPEKTVEFVYACSHQVWDAARVIFEMAQVGQTTTGPLRLQDFKAVYVDEEIIPEQDPQTVEPARLLLQDMFNKFKE